MDECEFTLASSTRRAFASRERHIVSVFATICWFHELRINLDAPTVATVQRSIEPALETEIGAVSLRWWGYKNGRHAPSAKVVALAQAKCPASAVAFRSPLWDALRLDRSATHMAKALAGKTTKFGDEILVWLLDLSRRPQRDPRWIHKRCLSMIKHGSFEGLAVLTVGIRLAAVAGLDHLAMNLYRWAAKFLPV
jgi:hypothetical protein